METSFIYIYTVYSTFDHSDPALQNSISQTLVGFGLAHQTKRESFSSQQYNKEDIYSHHPINLFQPELLLYSTKNKTRSSRPGNTSNLKFTSSRSWPRRCLGAGPNLFKTPFGPVPRVWVAVVSSCSVKGWVDRQTYKQTAFISLRETWQQRAQLPGHISPHPSISPFYLSCHRPSVLKRKHGVI